MSALPDADDVHLAQAGDREAFARLVRTYSRRVYDLARRMLRDPEDAEDVVQQAFSNAWRALDRFDPERPFRNWLLRIASNLCRNRIAARQRQKVRPAVGGDVDVPDVPARADDGAPRAGRSPEESGTLRAAVEALPERYRVAVVLHYIQGLPLAEVSEITETPVATLKTHLFRARQTLRRLLDEDGNETAPPPGGTKG